MLEYQLFPKTLSLGYVRLVERGTPVYFLMIDSIFKRNVDIYSSLSINRLP